MEQPIVFRLNATDAERLRKWLEWPSAALTTDTDMTQETRRGLVFTPQAGGDIEMRMVER